MADIFDYENDTTYDHCLEVQKAKFRCHIQRLMDFWDEVIDDNLDFDDVYEHIKGIAKNIVEYKKMGGDDYDSVIDGFHINFRKRTPDELENLDENLTDEEKDILFPDGDIYQTGIDQESWFDLSEEMKKFLIKSGKINKKELWVRLSEEIEDFDELEKLIESFKKWDFE